MLGILNCERGNICGKLMTLRIHFQFCKVSKRTKHAKKHTHTHNVDIPPTEINFKIFVGQKQIRQEIA